jgi:methionyl-tRNA formyltransferase
MRLILIGTGPFAVPAFEQLYSSRHTVMALVTAPEREHRGRPIEAPSPLRRFAREHGTPIVDPPDINAPEARQQLRSYAADLLVVCDYGQILKRETLAAARLGGINLHASLLPKYRGAAPINWAIYHGETHTGVTVIHMTPELDAGPCIARAEAAIGPEETAVELEARLAQLGGGVLAHSVDMLEAGRAEPLPQDPALASKAPRLKKTDGAIDWTRPAAAIKNQVRALEPWPKTYTFWHRRQGSPLRLILGPVRVVENFQELPTDSPLLGSVKQALNRELFRQPPGTVLCADSSLLIAAGQGAIAPLSIQPAGKRMMPTQEFLRGHRIEPIIISEVTTTGGKLIRGFHIEPVDRFGPE